MTVELLCKLIISNEDHKGVVPGVGLLEGFLNSMDGRGGDKFSDSLSTRHR